MSDENKMNGDQAEWLSLPAKPVVYEIPAHAARVFDPTRPRVAAPPVDELPIYRRFSPRRNRWQDVARFDERAGELERRVAALTQEIDRLQVRRREAGKADRNALTEWQLQGGQGPRPEPTVPAIEREIEERTTDRDAASQAIERVYEEKERYVDKHRKRLEREAQKWARAAHGRMADALDAYERAREELVEAREAQLWAALYPSELAQTTPNWTQLATGLRKPVEGTLGVKTVVTAANVVAALRADADVLREVTTQDQAAALRSVTTAELTGRVAEWQEGQPDLVGPHFPAT